MVQKQVISMVVSSLLRCVNLLDSLHNEAYPEFHEVDFKGLPELECCHNISYNIVSYPGLYR